jgi:hypothetical protein
MFRNSSCRPARTGTTPIQLAVIVPVFLTAAFPLFEYGHAHADSKQSFLVRATTNYCNVSLMPKPLFNGATRSGQAFMRHE